MSFYFGYQGNLQSVKVPTTGLERTQTAYRSSGVLTNGGGWARSSTGEHYLYVMNWDFIRSADYAQIRSLYGYDELIHFLDPQAAVTNSLPPYIAEAGKAAKGGYRLIRPAGLASVTETSTLAPAITTGPQRTARYAAISSAPRKSVWLPVPSGHTIHLRGLTASSGSTRITLNGVALPAYTSGTTVPSLSIPSPVAQGVSLAISAGDAIDIRWLQTMVLPTGQTPVWGDWQPGLGHSGCRLDTDPTYTLYSAPQAIDYGALSLTLRETGAWE